MKHLSLFSGIGGLDLAAEMAGFTTVGQVEINDYCNRVLEYHWPDVPRWRDIKDVTAETFEEHTGIGRGGVALLSGGFPCQPFSCAGKRRGREDERYLWDEMLRVICEIRPRWVVAENVRGLLSIDTGRTYGRILADLAENGYCVGWLCYGAGDVGAPHKRERVFIVANATSLQCQTGAEVEGVLRKVFADQRKHDNADRPGKTRNTDVAYPTCGKPWQPETGNGREGAGRGSENLAYTPRLLLNRAGETGTAGWGELADGGMADTEKPGLEKPTRQSRGAEENPRPERGNADTGQENGTRQGPTQPGLGDFADGLSSGLVGYRWPAGINGRFWPSPAAGDTTGGGQAKQAYMAINKIPRESGCSVQLKLRDAVLLWPAGPGEQHEWEPPRIATGVKDRVNKLKALGNAVVPAQAYPVFRAIMEKEATS